MRSRSGTMREGLRRGEAYETRYRASTSTGVDISPGGKRKQLVCQKYPITTHAERSREIVKGMLIRTGEAARQVERQQDNKHGYVTVVLSVDERPDEYSEITAHLVAMVVGALDRMATTVEIKCKASIRVESNTTESGRRKLY